VFRVTLVGQDAVFTDSPQVNGLQNWLLTKPEIVEGRILDQTGSGILFRTSTEQPN